MIELKPVRSSNISAVGHDPVSSTLAVKFTSGKVYHYHDVPADVHAGLLEAESIGSHFAKNIRPNFSFTPQETDGSIDAAET